MSRCYPVDEKILHEMVQVIVNEVDPLRIILFGSRAKKHCRPDSDIDLLIIERTPFHKERSRLREATRLWKALAGFRVPKDILVFSQDEVEKMSDSVNHVLGVAMREGIVLYEAA
ncbi:MAG: nucleotidyltransferase domain-containing protein [Candidatus Omnitrophota bacterium]|jgi:predicted nucleotidyltransferase|nr:MAG: nucleotidyltransferase domain-containing protein [Candidatus Omnitrophota bacterium]